MCPVLESKRAVGLVKSNPVFKFQDKKNEIKELEVELQLATDDDVRARLAERLELAQDEANEMQMLDGRGDGGGGQGGGYAPQGNQGGYQNDNYGGGGNAAPQQNPAANQNQGGFSGPADDFDDDIPF